MSKVIKKAYAEEMKQGYNLRTAMEEASRCLLCHDAPLQQKLPSKKRIQQNSSVPCVLEILKVLLKQSVKTIHQLVVAQKSVLMVSCVNRLAAVLELINRSKSESFRNSQLKWKNARVWNSFMQKKNVMERSPVLELVLLLQLAQESQHYLDMM